MTKLYACQCHVHAISVNKDPQSDMLIVSLWNGYNTNLNLFRRIKEAVKMVIKGKAFVDEIVLSFEDSQSLAKEIQEATQKGGGDL